MLTIQLAPESLSMDSISSSSRGLVTLLSVAAMMFTVSDHHVAGVLGDAV